MSRLGIWITLNWLTRIWMDLPAVLRPGRVGRSVNGCWNLPSLAPSRKPRTFWGSMAKVDHWSDVAWKDELKEMNLKSGRIWEWRKRRCEIEGIKGRYMKSNSNLKAEESIELLGQKCLRCAWFWWWLLIACVYVYMYACVDVSWSWYWNGRLLKLLYVGKRNWLEVGEEGVIYTNSQGMLMPENRLCMPEIVPKPAVSAWKPTLSEF